MKKPKLTQEKLRQLISWLFFAHSEKYVWSYNDLNDLIVIIGNSNIEYNSTINLLKKLTTQKPKKKTKKRKSK